MVNRHGHVIPSSERGAASRLTTYLADPTVAHCGAPPRVAAKSPAATGITEYRYRDSNPPKHP